MRAPLSIAVLILQLPCTGTRISAAESPGTPMTLHVEEGVSAGHIVGNVSDLLGLSEVQRCRLSPDSHDGFEINSAGQLTVSADARLNHEDNLPRVLLFDIATPPLTDPLRNRFVNLLSKSADSYVFRESSRWERRVVRVDVIIDDRPEAPWVIPGVFPCLGAGPLDPGGALGRIIAADPDAGDRLQFRLLDNEALLQIDPDSGRISIRDDMTLPAVPRLTATVEVVDSHGLSDSRQVTIPLHPPLTSPLRDGEVPSRAADSVGDVTSTPVHGDSTKNPPPTETSKTTAARVSPDDTNVAPATVPDISSTPAEDESQTAEAGRPPPPTIPASPVKSAASGTIQHTTANSSWAAWWLICAGCAVVLGAICWGPIRRQCQTLILQPDTADAPATDDESIHLPRRPVETATTVAPNQSSTSTSEANMKKPVSKPDTQELYTLLTSLDESYGPSAAGASDASETSARRQCESRLERSPTGEASFADKQDHFLIDEDELAGLATATATAAATSVARDEAAIPSPVGAHSVPSSPVEHARSGQTERAQMEEFRQIARTYSRADIDRSRREQMRVEWMSRGAAVASSVITGTICLFTNCFGDISVPCGTLLLAVAAALLMKRSLYFEDSKPSVGGSTASEAASTKPAAGKPTRS